MLLIASLALIATMATQSTASPGPGDVFRDYVWKGPWVNAGNWQRVTDPKARHEGAQQFLPNPVNTVAIADLDQAIRAEVTIEQWGGHAGTSNKRLHLNGNDWIPIPEPAIPGDAGSDPRPECYQYLTYPSVPLPLKQLRPGDNTFAFTCDGQICFDFGWGQWGVYGVTFRIYYYDAKPHSAGRITAPAPGTRFGDSLQVQVEADADVESVDVIALYEDFDYEGNGAYRQWHYTYRYGRMQHHLGTAEERPFTATWSTDWVPDQAQPVSLMARVRNADGVYFMTAPVEGLILHRPDRSVQLYRPFDVPAHWQTRAGRRQACKVFLPHNLSRASAAQMILATWSGGHADAIGIDQTTVVERVGSEHNYSYDEVDVPLDLLHGGALELFTEAATVHHGIEVLWPGICLKVRYDAPVTAVVEAVGDGQPESARLLPNYPNPFNGSTTIPFEVAGEAPVRVAVYSVTGQRVAVLVQGHPGPGRHQVRWDGLDAAGRATASGVYVYRLETGARVETRRLMLVR